MPRATGKDGISRNGRATLADLTPDPHNARQHNPRNVGMIEAALREVGAARSIVIDEDGVVLAGNATIEAAAQAGIENVRVIDVDGETIVAVRRIGLTPEQKVRLALYDNRAAELAEWDTEALAEITQVTDLSRTLFRPDELAAILNGPGSPFAAPGATSGPGGEGGGEEVDDPFAEWRGMPEFQQDDLSAEFRCIVNFRRIEDLEAFEALIGQRVPRNVKSVWYPPEERARFRDSAYVTEDGPE